MKRFLSSLISQAMPPGKLSSIHSVLNRLLLIIGILIGLTSNMAHSESASEMALKTAFLYNFFRFIDWPPAYTDKHPLNLCTSEHEDLGDRLLVLSNKALGDKTITLRRNLDKKEMIDCHMVYIHPADNIAAILKQLNNRPIVTVSESPGFIDQGGIIGLIQTQRLSFEINLDKARQTGIHISAQLTKLAKKVKTSD